MVLIRLLSMELMRDLFAARLVQPMVKRLFISIYMKTGET